MTSTTAVVVMGVCGTGKSTVSKALCAKLSNSVHIEADSLHSPENILKMSSGQPLNDSDRWPWFQFILEAILSASKQYQTVVVSCSALKKAYRDFIRQGLGKHMRLMFVYLHCSDEVELKQRILNRQQHFMPVSLVKSQLETLEDPRIDNQSDVCWFDCINQSVDSICTQLIDKHLS